MSTVEVLKDNSAGNIQVISWKELGLGDEGKSCEVANTVFKTVQISGEFSGASLLIEGSIDGNNYHTLTDIQGISISKSRSSLESIAENVRYIKPRVEGGDRNTRIDVNILSKFER